MNDDRNLKTIRDFIRFAVTTFEGSAAAYGQGTQSAFDEACFLVLRALSLPLNSLDFFADASVSQGEREKITHYIDRRAKQHIPASYLLNEAWLRDYKFFVNESVLIPRSHISDIIFDQIDAWLPLQNNINQVLDLCTGSGCLAILAAERFPEAAVTCSDLSAEALEVAQKNINDYELNTQISAVQSDLFENIEGKFDLIISNPPYVDQKSMQQLPPEFKHEPHIALHGGDDGTDLACKIIQSAPAYLNKEGILIMEVGRDREALERRFPELAFTWIETQSGRDFVFLLTRADLASGLRSV
jgi:ribosomal protein L3 glutamine methyltransferase